LPTEADRQFATANNDFYKIPRFLVLAEMKSISPFKATRNKTRASASRSAAAGFTERKRTLPDLLVGGHTRFASPGLRGKMNAMTDALMAPTG
jgi:hypothetical protein